MLCENRLIVQVSSPLKSRGFHQSLSLAVVLIGSRHDFRCEAYFDSAQPKTFVCLEFQLEVN